MKCIFKVTLPNEKKWCRQRFSMHPAVLWARKAAKKHVVHVLQSWKCSELLKDHIGQKYAINITKKD